MMSITLGGIRSRLIALEKAIRAALGQARMRHLEIQAIDEVIYEVRWVAVRQ